MKMRPDCLSVAGRRSVKTIMRMDQGRWRGEGGVCAADAHCDVSCAEPWELQRRPCSVEWVVL